MASNAQNAQGTTIEISSTAGGAKTITDIALGNPTILTSAAHGLTNGDVVTAASFAGADAADINSNSYTIKNVTTNTFAIELDSTSLDITDNTDSATMTPVSWTEIGEIVGYDGFDGTAAIIPKTNLASTAVEKAMGLQDFGSLRVDIQIYDADTGQTAVRSAKTNRTQRNFKITLPNAETRTFAGYIISFTERGGVDAIVLGNTEIMIDGEVTYA